MKFLAITFQRFVEVAWNWMGIVASTVIRIQTTATTAVAVTTTTLLLGMDRGHETAAASENGRNTTNRQQQQEQQKHSDPPSSLYHLASIADVASLMGTVRGLHHNSVKRETRSVSVSTLDNKSEGASEQPEPIHTIQEECNVPKPDENSATTTTTTTSTTACNGDDNDNDNDNDFDCGSGTCAGTDADADDTATEDDNNNAPIDSKTKASPVPPLAIIHLPLRAERRIARVARRYARFVRCGGSSSRSSSRSKQGKRSDANAEQASKSRCAGTKRAWEGDNVVGNTNTTTNNNNNNNNNTSHPKLDKTKDDDSFATHPACLRTFKKTRWAVRFVARRHKHPHQHHHHHHRPRGRFRANHYSRRRAGIPAALSSSLESYGKQQKFRNSGVDAVLWARVAVAAAANNEDWGGNEIEIKLGIEIDASTQNTEDSVSSLAEQ
eukprot:jgi/Psemu1/57409/gm1.57409_g